MKMQMHKALSLLFTCIRNNPESIFKLQLIGELSNYLKAMSHDTAASYCGFFGGMIDTNLPMADVNKLWLLFNRQPLNGKE